jgi:glycine oxidase
VKNADVIVIGAGVIGLSLACDLRRAGHTVLVLEKHHPGREASWAAGGMIAWCEAGPHPAFRELAHTSAKMYPDFVHRLQDESAVNVDLRTEGKIRFRTEDDGDIAALGRPLTLAELKQMEPDLVYDAPAIFLPEMSVDPRQLVQALLNCALHLGVEVASGAEVVEVEATGGRVTGAITTKTTYSAAAIVNCAGAWAGHIPPINIPTRPIKGQMLCLVGKHPPLRHCIHGLSIYLVPRSDGRILVGATVEDVGFDKRVDPDVLQRFHQAAANLAPQFGQLRIHDDWAGLRPGTPDNLPILGPTTIEGYFVATGHYRDGIMLAPVTARLMTQMVEGRTSDLDVGPFSLARFQ